MGGRVRGRKYTFAGDVIDQAILLMCAGAPRETLTTRLADHLKLERPAAEALARRVRQIVRAAAAIDLVEETGVAIARLGRLLDSARAESDGRLQLNILKELHLLLGLHMPARSEAPPEPLISDTERAAAMYLRPLGLLPEDSPLADLVRVAATRLIDGVPLDLPTDEAPG
jgi:hypothetical protein